MRIAICQQWDHAAVDDVGYDLIEPLSEELLRQHRWLLNEFMSQQRCPYCTTRLETFEHDDCQPGACRKDGDAKWKVWQCMTCGYWQLATGCYKDTIVGQWSNYDTYISKLASFEGELPECLTSEFAQYLRRNPEAWCRFSPRAMEMVVTDLFRLNHREAQVVHVGKPDDGGVDVIYIRTDEQKYLIQVKRRSRADHAESVGTLRSLVGTLVDFGELRGVVVTTADHFSYRAREYVDRQTIRGYEIGLVDRGILGDMLDPAIPNRPWLPAIKDHIHRPDLMRLFTRHGPRKIDVKKPLRKVKEKGNCVGDQASSRQTTLNLKTSRRRKG